mgnify:FL=1
MTELVGLNEENRRTRGLERGLRRQQFYLGLLLEQDGPQDEKTG